MASSPFARLLLFLARHRAVVFVATALLMLLALIQSRRVGLNDDYLVMMPSEDPYVADFMAFNNAFKQLERMVFDVSIRLDDPAALAEVADALDAGLAETGKFGRVTYRLAQDNQTDLVSTLLGSMPSLMNAEDLAALELMLARDSIREYLTRMRKELSGPNGVFLKYVLPYDPIGVSGRVLQRLEVLGAGVGGASIVEGRIASADGRHLMLVGEPIFPSSDYKASAVLMAELNDLILRIAADHPAADPKIITIGGHRAALDNVTIIERDIRRTLGVAIATMIALSLFAYRRRWLAFATMLPAVFGALMAGLVLSITHEAIYSISMGFGVILLGITVDYAIHVIFHLENHAAASEEGKAEIVAQVARPIAMGSVTTIGAFALMTASPVAGHKQVGLFAAVGLASAAAFSVIILPLLIPRSRAKASTRETPLPLTRAFERLMSRRDRHAVSVLLFAAAFTVACVFGVSRLRFEGDLARINGVTDETKAAEQSIRATWGDALALTTIMVSGEDEATAFTKNDRLARVLAELERQGLVASISSIGEILPSPQTQNANLARWREFWSSAKRERTRAVISEEAGALGYSAAAFAPFFDLIESGGSPISLAALREGPLGSALEQRIAETDSGFAVSTMLQFPDRSAAGLVRETILLAIPDAAMVDGRALADHVSDLAREGLRLFALLATVAVVLVLSITLGSIELVAVTLAPIVIAILWTFGVMGFAGIPVDLFNSVFIIFIIGVGIDYSIFLVTARLAPMRGQIERFSASGGSITICALTTMISCGVLILARHPALFSIGVTSLLGMFFSFVSALVFVPLGASILLSRAQTSGTPRAWHLLGGMWIFSYALLAQLLLFRVVHPALRLRNRRTPEKILPRLRELGRAGLRGMFSKFPYGTMSYGNIGAETFAEPAVVISNHESSVDIPLIASLPGDVRLTLKPRVAAAPWLGVAARKLGHIIVRPGDPEATIEACREAMAQGASVHFFPEATRSADGFIGRFHKGAFELAIALDCEVLPIVLCDTRTSVPRDGYWVEYPKMGVRALDRITPGNFDYSLGARELMRHSRDLLREGHQAALDENNTPDHLRRKVARRYRYQGPIIEFRVNRALRSDPLFTRLDSIIPRAASILEVQCGFGPRGHWLAELTDSRRYTGVDTRGEMIRVARQSVLGGRRVQFEHRDILDWEWPRVDAIILGEGSAVDGLEPWRILAAKAAGSINERGIVLVRLGKADLPADSIRELFAKAGFQPAKGIETGSERAIVFRAQEQQS